MRPLKPFKSVFVIGEEPLTVKNERLTALAYTELLTRTELGKQSPREDFERRIATLLQQVQIRLVVRNAAKTIVAICFRRYLL